MKACDLMGAGVVLFFWIVALVVPQVFERQLGEGTGFLILIIGIVGVWAGLAARTECKQRGSR